MLEVEPKFKNGEKVVILNGPYWGMEGEVLTSYYRSGDDAWMVRVSVDNDKVKNAPPYLELSDDRVEKVKNEPYRVEGEPIDPQDVQVGDEIDVSYLIDDVRMSRVGVVGKISGRSDSPAFTSASGTSLFYSNWGYPETVITLLEANKVHPLEGVGVGTHFTVMPDNNENFHEYRYVKYADNLWIEELRKNSQITGLIPHGEDDVRAVYLRGGVFLNVIAPTN